MAPKVKTDTPLEPPTVAADASALSPERQRLADAIAALAPLGEALDWATEASTEADTALTLARAAQADLLDRIAASNAKRERRRWMGLYQPDPTVTDELRRNKAELDQLNPKVKELKAAAEAAHREVAAASKTLDKAKLSVKYCAEEVARSELAPMAERLAEQVISSKDSLVHAASALAWLVGKNIIGKIDPDTEDYSAWMLDPTGTAEPTPRGEPLSSAVLAAMATVRVLPNELAHDLPLPSRAMQASLDALMLDPMHSIDPPFSASRSSS